MIYIFAPNNGINYFILIIMKLVYYNYDNMKNLESCLIVCKMYDDQINFLTIVKDIVKSNEIFLLYEKVGIAGDVWCSSGDNIEEYPNINKYVHLDNKMINEIKNAIKDKHFNNDIIAVAPSTVYDITKFKFLIESGNINNFKVNIIGLDNKWDHKMKGFKLYILRDYLKEIKLDKQIICFTDAYDVFYSTNLQKIKDIFLSFSCNIVMSTELMYSHQLAQNKNFYDALGKNKPARYVNTGGYIGYANKLLELVEDAIKYLEKNRENIKGLGDQFCISCVIKNNWNKYGIVLDYDSRIFYTATMGKITEQQKTACITHIPWKKKYGYLLTKLFLKKYDRKTVTHTGFVSSNINKKIKVAGYSSRLWHYEMFGYIIHYCKINNYELTIYNQMEQKTFGSQKNENYLPMYEKIFYDYDINFVHIDKFENDKHNYDVIFLFTDNDFRYSLQDKNINAKTICIDHLVDIRNPTLKHHIAVRPFPDNMRDYALPIYPIFKEKDKKLSNAYINIACVGAGVKYNKINNVVNRLKGDIPIRIHFIARRVNKNLYTNIKHKYFLYKNIDMAHLCRILEICNYMIVDLNDKKGEHTYERHIMSGSIPLSFSTITPLIISKQTNEHYKFKNIIEYNLNSKNSINLHKINHKEYEKERNLYIDDNNSLFDSYIDIITKK